jgi:hypothetical protein
VQVTQFPVTLTVKDLIDVAAVAVQTAQLRTGDHETVPTVELDVPPQATGVPEAKV